MDAGIEDTKNPHGPHEGSYNDCSVCHPDRDTA